MKHLLLIAGIGVIGYALYNKHIHTVSAMSPVATNTPGPLPATGGGDAACAVCSPGQSTTTDYNPAAGFLDVDRGSAINGRMTALPVSRPSPDSSAGGMDSRPIMLGSFDAFSFH